MAQSVKSLPAMWETQVQSQGWEDPLEKEMATCSSILAWEIPWTEEPVGYNPWGCKESVMNEQSGHIQKFHKALFSDTFPISHSSYIYDFPVS